MSYRKRGLRHVLTVGYIYDLLDRNGDRVVGYHWHPLVDGPIADPHLHVGRQFAHPALPAGIRARADRLVRGHLPTERVLLPTILRFAIAELGVEPLRGDWQDILDTSERKLRLRPTEP